MASMYKDILSHIEADRFLSLLSRDDLSAPSETFVFKSVMQWINYKKEERMAVAAKVIEAVRLGLVDIKDVIKHLDTEEMKRIPEVFMLVYETLKHNCMPSNSSTFSMEKAKPRARSPVLVAVCPQSQIQCFDVAFKQWKPLEFLAPAAEAVECHCVESVGSKLYVAGTVSGSYCIYSYDIERNEWEKVPHSCGKIEQLCIVGDHMYAVGSDWRLVSQRYNFPEQRWQSFATAGITGSHNFNSGAAAFNSKLFVLYQRGGVQAGGYWSLSNPVLYCFDPAKNVWENKASTCQHHCRSSLVVANGRLFVAGGYNQCNQYGNPKGNFAPVEVYDEENNKWSLVDQKHIPSNNLGAVELDGRVYFIINRFPIDSGIRIPPGELYPVCLDKWKPLSNIAKNAALCYAPLKRETLKAD